MAVGALVVVTALRVLPERSHRAARLSTRVLARRAVAWDPVAV